MRIVRLVPLAGIVLGMVLWTASALLTTGASAAPAASQAGAGTLNLRVSFPLVSSLVNCPVNVLPAGFPPAAAECRARSGTASARGLGTVSVTYTWPLGIGPPTCAANFAKALPATGQLSVAGKGGAIFALDEAAQCVSYDAFPQNQSQDFTLTSGTGSFAGLAGSGTVALRAIGGGTGRETWTGTLNVPGLTFDLTPPKLSGARPKTVRAPKTAKSARVSFTVTATDDVDGSVPVSCVPRSGSHFRVGKTRVRCQARDSSDNAGSAAFTVTVKRRL